MPVYVVTIQALDAFDMTHTIIIETENSTVFEQIKEFAQRIGVPFSEKHTGTETVTQEAALKKFAGSWEGEESADQLISIVYSARQDWPRDIDL